MKAILFFALFIGQVQAFSQAPGFNLRLITQYPNSQVYKVLVENDTIVTLGIGYKDTINWERGLMLMKFDTLGSLLQAAHVPDTLFGGPNPLLLHIRWGSILSTPDNGYLMNVVPYLFEYPVLLKTDHDFNIEFIKSYPDTSGHNYQLNDIISIPDGYLLFGAYHRWNDQPNGYILKINLAGDAVWVSTHGSLTFSETVNDIEMINDSMFAVALIKSLTSTSSLSSVKIINQHGEVLQTWNSEPEPEIGYLRDILWAAEDGLLTYGLYVAETLPPNNTKLVKSTLSRLDEDFNVEWSRHYGNRVSLSSEVMFYDFEHTIDGNYISAGKSFMTLPNNGPSYGRGWLMKFSPEGDSIWSRQDTSDVMPVHFLNKHVLGGVGVLSSGSIVAGGYVTKGQEDYVWLIKVTNDGCIDTLYCGLVSGTEEMPSAGEELEVSVYPNPANEVVYIQVPVISGKAYMEISVFDLSGQQRKVLFADTESDMTLPVYDLPSGIYFISIKLPDGRVRYGKVCVAH